MGNNVCNAVSTIILPSIYILCTHCVPYCVGEKRIILGNHGKVLIKQKSNIGEKVARREYRLLKTS